MTTRKLLATSPGEMLTKEFLQPLGITAYRLAKSLGVPQTRISAIISGHRAITPDTAIRLSFFFGNSAEFWTNLQAGYDLKMAKLSSEKKIKLEVIPLSKEKSASKKPNKRRDKSPLAHVSHA
jgi:addiction module HigA family antidote